MIYLYVSQPRQTYRQQDRGKDRQDKKYLLRTSLGRQHKEHFKREGPQREITPWDILFAATVGVTVINAATHVASGGSGSAPVIHDSCGVTHYDNDTTYHFKLNFSGYNDSYSNDGKNFTVAKYCKAGSSDNAGTPKYGYQKFLFGDKVKNKDKAAQALDACPKEKADFKSCYYADRKVSADFDAKLVNRTIKDHRQVLEFEVEGNVGPAAKNSLAPDPSWLALLAMMFGSGYLARRRKQQKD